MIQSFKCKETKIIFERQFSKKFPHEIHRVALRKLVMIHCAVALKDLRSPQANHLELLQGNRKGQYSIRINKRWRICFYWRNHEAWDVEIVDYH